MVPTLRHGLRPRQPEAASERRGSQSQRITIILGDGQRHQHTLPPALSAFLDGLAVLIAEAILENAPQEIPSASKNLSANPQVAEDRPC